MILVSFFDVVEIKRTTDINLVPELFQCGDVLIVYSEPAGLVLDLHHEDRAVGIAFGSDVLSYDFA